MYTTLGKDSRKTHPTHTKSLHKHMLHMPMVWLQTRNAVKMEPEMLLKTVGLMTKIQFLLCEALQYHQKHSYL